MKKIIRLTENDLKRIVNRAVSENYDESSLYQDIKGVLRNSNYPPETRVDVLRRIADEIENGITQRKDILRRWGK